MKILQNITFKYDHRDIHIYGPHYEPWFCCIDVAYILGYKNSEYIRRKLNDSNKQTLKELLREYPIKDLELTAVEKKMAYMNEDGLEVIFGLSKSNKALKFKAWLYNDILPMIKNIDTETHEEVYNESEDESKGYPEEATINESEDDESKETNIEYDISNIFTFNDKTVRIYEIEGTTWFCGRDVANILEYKDSRDALRRLVPDRYKKSLDELLDLEMVGETHTGYCVSYHDGKMTYINEPGLYELIFSSRLEVAKNFKEWVFEKVLPTIRKTGEYKINKEVIELKNKLKEQEMLIKKQDYKMYWLHHAAKKSVSFKVRTEDDDAVYQGAHPTEYFNHIQKFGKTKDTGKRIKEHSTSSVELNKFKMYRIYTLPSDLVGPYESFIHSLLDPVMVKDNPKRKEHFMIHAQVMESINLKLVKTVKECVKELNDYVRLVEDNNRNFTEVSKALGMTNLLEEQKEFKHLFEIKNEDDIDQIDGKKCVDCDKFLAHNMYELNSRRNARVDCIECVNKKELKCRLCEVFKLGEHFIVDSTGLRSRICKECKSKEKIIYKTCRRCKINMPNTEYDRYPSGHTKHNCKKCME